jgi:hypothetical protein
MSLTRRQFIKSVAMGAAALAIPIPAFTVGRRPYVIEGSVVDYIGHHPGGFIGSQVVKKIGEWDGVGFPVQLHTNTFPPQIETYYDFDLTNMILEVPEGFWHNPANHVRYPNVHTYLRVQRFGESVEQAIRHLNYSNTRRFLERFVH